MDTKMKGVSLPPKENGLFKRVVKCYEQKMYRNALKFAKQILGNSLYAEHGETLAMKGLILNAMGRREEGYEFVRRGLKNNLQSHTCWHVYGLIQRSEHKYEEALKCYRNALKWAPANIEILRELSVVQIHLRDLKGYRDTKQQLFSLKPTQRVSWIGLAISYHLLKDYDMAYKILEEFRKSAQSKDGSSKDAIKEYEHSELLLYQNTLLQEKGDLQDALNHLKAHQTEICDKTVLNEFYGTINYKLYNFDQAVHYYKMLMNASPDNGKYHDMYIKSLGIEDNPKEIIRLYESFGETSKGTAFILKYAQREEFLLYLRPFLQQMLSKGAPSLFAELKCLYIGEKTELMENCVLALANQLERNSKYHEWDVDMAPPSALLWTYYYLAQHYDYLENIDAALQYVEKAINHTPTLADLFICKAKIYKHAGEYEKAAEFMDEARELDTADRYVNNKSAKYHLRADHVAIALNVFGKFTREGKNPAEEINEMQVMWFEVESALAHQRLGQWGEALKKCHEIDQHFTDVTDDQFDFHTYSIRRLTLTSYIKLLRLEDIVRSHPFYFKAAKCAIEIYLHLYDTQSEGDKGQVNEEDKLSPAELKKLKNKMRKAQKKAEAELQAAALAAQKKEQHAKSKHGTGEDGDPPPKTEDLAPEKLEKTSDPLKEAARFLEPLLNFASNHIKTHLLAYEFYRRRGKPLLMLRSIKRALKCISGGGNSNPTLVEFCADFKENVVVPALKGLPGTVHEFIQESVELINKETGIALSSNSDNLPMLPTRSRPTSPAAKCCWRKQPKQIPFVQKI